MPLLVSNLYSFLCVNVDKPIGVFFCLMRLPIISFEKGKEWESYNNTKEFCTVFSHVSNLKKEPLLLIECKNEFSALWTLKDESFNSFQLESVAHVFAKCHSFTMLSNIVTNHHTEWSWMMNQAEQKRTQSRPKVKHAAVEVYLFDEIFCGLEWRRGQRMATAVESMHPRHRPVAQAGGA